MVRIPIIPALLLSVVHQNAAHAVQEAKTEQLKPRLPHQPTMDNVVLHPTRSPGSSSAAGSPTFMSLPRVVRDQSGPDHRDDATPKLAAGHAPADFRRDSSAGMVHLDARNTPKGALPGLLFELNHDLVDVILAARNARQAYRDDQRLLAGIIMYSISAKCNKIIYAVVKYAVENSRGRYLDPAVSQSSRTHQQTPPGKHSSAPLATESTQLTTTMSPGEAQDNTQVSTLPSSSQLHQASPTTATGRTPLTTTLTLVNTVTPPGAMRGRDLFAEDLTLAPNAARSTATPHAWMAEGSNLDPEPNSAMKWLAL
jgi:hypothetical protein